MIRMIVIKPGQTVPIIMQVCADVIVELDNGCYKVVKSKVPTLMLSKSLSEYDVKNLIAGDKKVVVVKKLDRDVDAGYSKCRLECVDINFIYEGEDPIEEGKKLAEIMKMYLRGIQK
jgi:hypothetical protein